MYIDTLNRRCVLPTYTLNPDTGQAWHTFRHKAPQNTYIHTAHIHKYTHTHIHTAQPNMPATHVRRICFHTQKTQKQSTESRDQSIQTQRNPTCRQHIAPWEALVPANTVPAAAPTCKSPRNPTRLTTTSPRWLASRRTVQRPELLHTIRHASEWVSVWGVFCV